MPPEGLDFRQRADLAEFPELMDAPCSRDEMQACLEDLARVNRWFLAYRPTLKWLDALALRSNGSNGSHGSEIHILDVGCGYGDSLRRIELWASERNLPVALTGCDLNPDAVAIAREASPARSKIRWISSDVFALKFDRPVDIIVSSLFTHHLTDDEIVRFLGWMERSARVGWFINDLSRASMPYRLFKTFAKVANLHPFVQHDGPVSIARAFVADDWTRMCSAAGLGRAEVSLESFKPARLCVGRKKQAVKQ